MQEQNSYRRTLEHFLRSDVSSATTSVTEASDDLLAALTPFLAPYRDAAAERLAAAQPLR